MTELKSRSYRLRLFLNKKWTGERITFLIQFLLNSNNKLILLLVMPLLLDSLDTHTCSLLVCLHQVYEWTQSNESKNSDSTRIRTQVITINWINLISNSKVSIQFKTLSHSLPAESKVPSTFSKIKQIHNYISTKNCGIIPQRKPV